MEDASGVNNRSRTTPIGICHNIQVVFFLLEVGHKACVIFDSESVFGVVIIANHCTVLCPVVEKVARVFHGSQRAGIAIAILSTASNFASKSRVCADRDSVEIGWGETHGAAPVALIVFATKGAHPGVISHIGSETRECKGIRGCNNGVLASIFRIV